MKSILFSIIMITALSCTSTPPLSIEKGDEITYTPDYLGTWVSEERDYGSSSTMLIHPFWPASYCAEYHIIAYFQGHETYESMEAFVFQEEGQGNHPIRAILTDHQNQQVDYINFPTETGELREVHTAAIAFNINSQCTEAQLKLEDQFGREYVLNYSSENPVDSNHGGLTDVGGHSPMGGLPLFYRNESGISSQESTLFIDGKEYTIPVDDQASAPPYFIAKLAYISQGYNSLIYRAGSMEFPTIRLENSAIENPIRYGNFQNHMEIQWNQGIPEIRSITHGSSGDDSSLQKIIFNPPFPNVDSMKIGDSYGVRFHILFGDSPPQVYGDILISKTSTQSAIIKVTPAYPSWTRDSRIMEYRLNWNQENLQITAEVCP